MIKILLIRHALTDSVGKRLSGRSRGLSLNAEGREQAQALAERITGLPIAAIYSSPLERALETAEPIAKLLDIPCFTSEDFVEIDFGKWTNYTLDELKEDPLFERFNSFRSVTRPPDGELMLEAQSRIVKGIEKLHAQHQNKTIAVISHADMIKSAVAYYAGIPLDLFHRIEISPASVSMIQLYDDTACLHLLNETGSIKI
jgi:probable phosphomutase (TIGR03848 family)